MHFDIFNSYETGNYRAYPCILILRWVFCAVQGSFHTFQEKRLCECLKICMLAHTVPDRFPACWRPRLSTLGVKPQ